MQQHSLVLLPVGRRVSVCLKQYKIKKANWKRADQIFPETRQLELTTSDTQYFTAILFIQFLS